MPVPNEIGLLSTRVDSYRHPIDTQTTAFRHPKTLVLPSAANRLKPSKIDHLSTGVDSYRHGSTGFTKLKTKILNGSGRQWIVTIRHGPANDLWNIKNPPWPPVGIGFGGNNILTGGQFPIKTNPQTITKSEVSN